MLRATFAEAKAVREAGEKTVALGQKEAALAIAETNEIQAKAAQNVKVMQQQAAAGR